MTFDLKPILIIIAIALISSLGGYFIGAYQNGNKYILPAKEQLNTAPSVKETAPADKQDGFFSTQTATVDGVIIKSTDSVLTIKNSKGEVKEFPVAQNVLTIYGYNSGKAKSATSTPQLKEIATGKPVLVNLGFIDNEYRVVSITYLPAAKPKTDER